MLTLGYVETVQTIQLRNRVAEEIVKRAQEGKPSVKFSAADARRLADDGIILAQEAGKQAADELQAELRERVAQTGTSAVAPLLVASTCFGLAGLAAIVGLWRPQ